MAFEKTRNYEGALTATLVSGSASAAGANAIGTSPANTQLRKLILALSSNATQSTAGENTVTVNVGGVTVFTENIYVPASASLAPGVVWNRDIDFGFVGFDGGALSISLGQALTAGAVYVNAYFG